MAIDFWQEIEQRAMFDDSISQRNHRLAERLVRSIEGRTFLGATHEIERLIPLWIVDEMEFMHMDAVMELLKEVHRYFGNNYLLDSILKKYNLSIEKIIHHTPKKPENPISPYFF